MKAVVEAGTETIGLVQQFLERSGQLYSLPAVAAEILRLTDQPQIDPRAVKKCLESDPALAARILRVANSSLFGATRQVTNLSQALTLLGIRPLKMLVLGFSLPKELLVGVEAEVLAGYWRLALTKAVAARELCEQLWHSPGEEAFLAGLVQDIGMLVLLKELGGSYQKLLCHAQVHGSSLLEYELDTLGFDHLVLSARLLTHWGLPPDFCAAISVPPDEKRIAELTQHEAKLPRILHVAHLLALMLDQPYGSALNELLAVGERYCGLDYGKLQPIAAVVQQRVGEMAEVLSLEVGDRPTNVELLLEAHEKLAAECVAAAKNPKRQADEKELLRLTEELRDEVAHSVGRGQGRSGSDNDVGIGRANSSAGGEGQRKTTVQADDQYDPALEAKVASAIRRSRESREPVALAIVEIDDFSDLLLKLGPAAAGELIFELRGLLLDWCEECSPILLSDSRLALVLENSSRSEAVELARELQLKVHPWSEKEAKLPSTLALSIGVAALDYAPKNYPPRQLVGAAFGCLSAAQLSGGNAVKSIAV